MDIAPDQMTLDELRPVLIAAMLPNVPFDGWTLACAEQGCRDLGVPAERARLVKEMQKDEPAPQKT